MSKDSDEIRNAAALIRRGDLYDNLARAKYPRRLPELYEEVAMLRDRIDAYGEIIKRLNERLEHATPTRSSRLHESPPVGAPPEGHKEG